MSQSTTESTIESPQLTVPVQSAAGDLGRTVDLPAEVFGVQVNVPLIHQVVVAQLAAARQGTHDTKTRGEVSGGGKKPYRQKGTGRARQGSIRAPQFTGGGTVHGPTPRSYVQRTPKKMKLAALRGALSDRARDGRVHVVADFGVTDRPRTKDALATLATVVGDRRALVVIDRADEVTWLSLRNVPTVHLIAPDQLNSYDVLVNDDVVFTEAALAAFLGEPPPAHSGTVGDRSGAPGGTGREIGIDAAAADIPATTPVTPPVTPPVTATTAATAAAATEAAGEPATPVGRTVAAGEGVSDAELADQVAEQTDPNLAVDPAAPAPEEAAE